MERTDFLVISLKAKKKGSFTMTRNRMSTTVLMVKWLKGTKSFMKTVKMMNHSRL
jgi:hypothetical protein